MDEASPEHKQRLSLYNFFMPTSFPLAASESLYVDVQGKSRLHHVHILPANMRKTWGMERVGLNCQYFGRRWQSAALSWAILSPVVRHAYRKKDQLGMHTFIEGSTRTILYCILLPAECRDCSWDGVECLTRLRLNNGLAVCTVSGGWGGGEGRPKWPGKEIRKLSWFLITFCELNVIFMCVREYVVRVCTSHVCIHHVCVLHVDMCVHT